MYVQIAGRLNDSYAALSNHFDSLDLKLAAEFSLFHMNLQFDEHPFLGVRQTGSSS
jgi:hypothetical protein